MEQSSESNAFTRYSKEDLEQLALETIGKVSQVYQPGKDRQIIPGNVYQPARPEGKEFLTDLIDHKLLLPGSRFEGLENLDHCLGELRAGRHVIFLPEHRGNLDAYTFDVLLRREDARYQDILDRLIFIAGRKLNESSELIKMFTEKYPRLVIVPRRDYPEAREGENAEEIRDREEYINNASRINRSAFRQLIRLKKAGHIFILYPLGGRVKPGADNHPVRETTSYLQRFDTAYLISMEGNLLPPRANMEEERPVQEKVVLRVGKPLQCKDFLASMKARHAAEKEKGGIPPDQDWEQYAVERIMNMLERLRLAGDSTSPETP